MLTSLLNCFDQFRKQFSAVAGGNITITDTDNSTVELPVIYARETLTQIKPEAYPVISIYDYEPEIDPNFLPTPEQRIDAYRAVNNVDHIWDTATVFYDPIAFIFNYDVSVFVKKPRHRLLMQNYMYSRFQKRGTFLYNSTSGLPGYSGEVGDAVLYTMDVTNAPRTDGVYETTYHFTCECRVHIQMPEDVQLIQQFILSLGGVSVETDSQPQTNY